MKKKPLRIYLFLLLFLLLTFVVYRIFLIVNKQEFFSVNAVNIEKINKPLSESSDFNFAVVGNIRNSMRIFSKLITPHIIENKADFIISPGNAVFDGGETKYRLLYHGMERIGIPYIVNAGNNEIADFGSEKFYNHFGPYYFSFSAANSYFIFLDTTGFSSWTWQILWLREELSRAKRYSHIFVIMDQSPLLLDDISKHESDLIKMNTELRNNIMSLFTSSGVTAVFSNGDEAFISRIQNGVRYIITGGGGGLILKPGKLYQFALVEVHGNEVLIKNVEATSRLGVIKEWIESVKLYLYSLLYMSLFNIILLVSITGLIALEIYYKILQQEHLYRDFDLEVRNQSSESMNIAMFTNNYLPFVGGVPLSIDRLYHGLIRRGNRVRIYCPTFCGSTAGNIHPDIFRCPTLFTDNRINFPIANIFSPALKKSFNNYECSLVHVHHPYWLGSLGLHLARRRGIPVVFTYHTRLERYTHYIPIPGTPLKNLAAHFLIRHFANKCDAIITPTTSTEEYLRNLGVSSIIETIPTGIVIRDYSAFSVSEISELRASYACGNERLLISVSRMAREKNLDFLIDAVARIKQRTNIPFKCLLVGDGPERQRLEKKVEDIGLQAQIRFTGSLTPQEVILHYLAADLFVFASTSETQGMVLVEAMAGGCPVVAVRASGVYDVIKDDFNGYMVPENIENWASKIIDILNSPELLQELSENSRAYAEEFSVDNITSKIIRLYQNVIVLKQSRKIG